MSDGHHYDPQYPCSNQGEWSSLRLSEVVLTGGYLEGHVYIPHPSKASCLSFCLSVVYTWSRLNWVYVLVPFHSSYMKSVLGAEAGGDGNPLTHCSVLPAETSPDMLVLLQMPPLPVVPPIAPLATVDSLPTALPDLPATSGPTVPPPSQYFSPAVILPSLPLNATTAPLPASPALPLQTVKLPHPAGAPLAVPCRTIVPNVAATATAIPLLAVAPQGVAALSIHPTVAQLPAQPVYPAAFPQMVPSDVPPSPLHAAQTVRAAAPQPAPPVLPQPHQPSVARLPEQAAPTASAGSQVTHLLARAHASGAGRPLSK